MSDQNSKKDDKTEIVPLGQPEVSPQFTDLRNLVLTTISTEEAERQLAEMSLDLSNFALEEDEQAIDFNPSLLPPVSPTALPSSQILAEGAVDAGDIDFSDFETMDENLILAQIEERVVDLENGPVQLGDLDEDGLKAATAQNEDAAEEVDDLAGFSDINLGGLDLSDSSGLEDVDFQPSFAESAADSDDSPEDPPFMVPTYEQEGAIPGNSETDDFDPALLDMDFGDQPILSTEIEAAADLDMPFQVAALEPQGEPEDLDLSSIDFEAPSLPASYEAPGQGEVVDAFDPSAFNLSEPEIATDAFTPNIVDDEAPGSSELDALFELRQVDQPADASSDQAETLDIDIPDFNAQDDERQVSEAADADADAYVMPEDDFVIPEDDAVDMVELISSERDDVDVDDAPPAYDALESERVLVSEQITIAASSEDRHDRDEPVVAVETVDVMDDEPAIFAESPKIAKKRGWILPLAASVAAIALAAGGGYYYYSIGTPGLEQYLGGQRAIADNSTNTMPGTDVSQVVLPQNFEPVTEQVPLINDQGSVIPDMQSADASSSSPPFQPVEVTAEISALFADLDAAGLGAAPQAEIPLPIGSGVEATVIDAIPQVKDFDFGLTKVPAGTEPASSDAIDIALDPVVTPDLPNEEVKPDVQDGAQAAATAPLQSAGSARDLASINEVQEMFAQQILTLQADIEDLKSASFAGSGQTNAMGELTIEVTRLAEQMAVVNARLMGVEGRVASAPTVTLPGANAGNDQALHRLEQQMELLSNNVGIIARMAASSSNSAVPGFNAVGDESSAPIPARRPASEAPRVSDSPKQAAGFTISSKPENPGALGHVAKGDFVEGYGYVLEVSPISGGGKLVQMENGTVLVE